MSAKNSPRKFPIPMETDSPTRENTPAPKNSYYKTKFAKKWTYDSLTTVLSLYLKWALPN